MYVGSTLSTQADNVPVGDTEVRFWAIGNDLEISSGTLDRIFVKFLE